MKNIKEMNIDGELVFMKKSQGIWRVVFPNKIDGEINWKNLIAGGNWWNLAKIGIIIIMILGCIYEYSRAVNIANECLKTNIFWGVF